MTILVNPPAGNFWLTVLAISGFCAVLSLGTWLFTRRALRRPPLARPDPALAARKEVAILLAREMYDRGDFKRAVISRVPSDLFTDDLVLECGHTSGTSPRGEEVTHANCHRCASDWIEAETKAKLKMT